MKRGNTALKRGVGLASAFALAIAGAVVAAPAASAFSTTPTSMIRATPAVDAPYVADASAPDYGASYSDGTSTGTVPNLTVGKTFQAASGVQVLLPVGSDDLPAWSKGDAITITLNQSAATTPNSKVTFSGVPTGISVGDKAIDSSSLDARAGHSGTNATAAAVDSTGNLKGAKVGAPSLSGSNTVLTVPLPDPSNAVAVTDSGDAYLLSINNISLNVASDVDVYQGLGVTATVAGTATAPSSPITNGGTTTIAWINPANLAANGAATFTGTTVTLPALVVAEAVAKVLPGTAGDVRLTVSGTPATGASVAVDTSKAEVVSNGDFTPKAAVTSTTTGTEIVMTYGAGAKDTVVESAAITGVKVTNVKAGTDVTVTVNGPAGFTTAVNLAAATGASDFSYTPDNDGGASVKLTPSSVLPRIAGANRYETAADIAAASSTWSGNAVVIANGENFKSGVDALSANFLAGAVNAPILLTQANALPKETSDALAKLFKNSSASITVYVMGKLDSVSQSVQDAIVKAITDSATVLASVKVVSVAGDDRYETSADAASQTGTNIASYDLGKGFLKTAFLASGQVNADALAAGAVSAGAHIPVLLTTNGDALPKSVSDAIDTLKIGQVVILGSTDRVSQKVEDALTTAGVNVVRVAGVGANGRYDTAARLADLAISAPNDGLGFTTGNVVYLANGAAGFPDALSVGPLAGLAHNVLLTVSDGAALPSETASFLKDNKDQLASVEALGQNDRVQDSVITAAQDAIK